jgi:hypothetical protein
MEKLNSSAIQSTIVQISVSVHSAGRHVVSRTLVAISSHLTTSIELLGNSLASDHAIIGIGNSIMAAHRLEQIIGTIASRIKITGSQIGQLNILTVHQANVVVRLAIFTADRLILHSFARATPSGFSECLVCTLKSAKVVVVDSISRTHWGHLESGTPRALVVSLCARSFVSHCETLALQKAR